MKPCWDHPRNPGPSWREIKQQPTVRNRGGLLPFDLLQSAVGHDLFTKAEMLSSGGGETLSLRLWQSHNRIPGSDNDLGSANITVTVGPYHEQKVYKRVIAVPFHCTSGKIVVEGPEETDVDRVFNVPQGDYKLTAAQMIVGDDKEQIDLFFEPVSTGIKIQHNCGC